MGRPVRFKEAIYDSALKLFSERGVSQTGIRDIARTAGVSEAALYRHWKGKRQLAQDIFGEGMTRLHHALTHEVPQAGPVCDAVRVVVRIFFDAYDKNPDLFGYLLLNQHEIWRTVDESVPNPVSFWFDLLRARAPDCHLGSELSGDILGPVTLGMLLRPSIAAAYGSIALPLAQHIDSTLIQCQSTMYQ